MSVISDLLRVKIGRSEKVIRRLTAENEALRGERDRQYDENVELIAKNEALRAALAEAREALAQPQQAGVTDAMVRAARDEFMRRWPEVAPALSDMRAAIEAALSARQESGHSAANMMAIARKAQQAGVTEAARRLLDAVHDCTRIDDYHGKLAPAILALTAALDVPAQQEERN